MSLFVKKLGLLAKMFFSRIETAALENLKVIPAGKKIIFATTHISDFDVQLVGCVIGNVFDRIKLAAGDELIESWAKPLNRLGGALAGKENLLAIHSVRNGKARRNIFNPDDFVAIKNCLDAGFVIVIAAYYDQHKFWTLPPKGGIGAVYLNHIVSDAVVIPVAVDVLSKKPLGMEGKNLILTALIKPSVKVVIGKSISFEPICNDGTFHSLKTGLKMQSHLLMVELAKLLPTEKRGKWQNLIKTE